MTASILPFSTRDRTLRNRLGRTRHHGVQLPMGSEEKTRKRIHQRDGDVIEAAPTPDVQRAIDGIDRAIGGQAERSRRYRARPRWRSRIQTAVSTTSRGKFRRAKTLTYGDIAKKLGGVELSRDVARRSGATRARSWCPAIACWRPAASPALLRQWRPW